MFLTFQSVTLAGSHAHGDLPEREKTALYRRFFVRGWQTLFSNGVFTLDVTKVGKDTAINIENLAIDEISRPRS